MSTDEAADTFVCPECRGTIPVDTQKRRALLRHGCAVCGAPLSEAAVAEVPAE
jgi:predicted RNA-binding Zn-ribbon protein involved in translation (DUF1610 family)